MQFDPSYLIQSAKIIQNNSSLESFLANFPSNTPIAIDSESAGFFKYRHVVNLIQIASDKQAAIIDPQAISELTSLKRFVQDSPRTWIIHGSTYDAAILLRDFGIKFPKIFDTRLAAQLLGINQLGLSSLCQIFLGFSLDKSLQKCDWSKRPLTQAMCKYALLDAVCLIPIYQILYKKLYEMNRLAWAEEEFQHILDNIQIVPEKPNNSPHAFLIKGYKTLSGKGLSVLKEIWELRERLASTIDRAPFMIVPNSALIELATKTPTTLEELLVIPNFPKKTIEQFGLQFIDAIKKGLNREIDINSIPKKNTVSSSKINPLTPWEGEIVKELREIRDTVASSLGIHRSLLASSDGLSALAQARPKDAQALFSHGALRKWQAELLCEKFLKVFQKEPPRSTKNRRTTSY